jgi:hypothetical protein
MRKILIACAMSALALGSASAQEVYLDDPDDLDDETYVETPAFEDADAVEEGLAPGPRVYGWERTRPDNCGTYKYWNGSYCADARDDPPESAD